MCKNKMYLLLLALLLVALMAGCGGSGGGGTVDPSASGLTAQTDPNGVSSGALGPTVASTIPAASITGVATNRSITAIFNETMTPATINGQTFILRNGVTSIPGTVAYAYNTAVFTPASELAATTKYTATVNRGATNLAGRGLATSYAWSFTTGADRDNDAFAVTSTIPANVAKGVGVYNPISATFNQPMNPATFDKTTFTLQQGYVEEPVAGSVQYAGQTLTFTPNKNLPASFVYTATLTTGVKDLAGHSRDTAFVWRFTTGVAPAFLRTARNFAVLAGSTVTNTALLTTVDGDLGVYPGSAVTGFPPGQVTNGTIHAGDAVAAQAKLDLTAAYNDAARRPRGPVTVAGNLGGQTLTPGIYKSTSSLAISSGDLTLDARGNVDAVFVFEMASTLTVTSGRQIILAGGAKADNIFWQVGSSATFGSTSVFKGNVLADMSITMDTGATLDGRLLARTGAITLDGNTINRPLVSPY